MTQKDVIQRILTELVTAEVITDDNHDLVKMYLQQAYGAGFDMARRQINKGKMIVQYTLENEPVRVFESAAHAARVLHSDKSAIAKCANGKRYDCAGYRWRWVDKLTASSVETVGTTQLESVQPKQGIHVSKISSV